MRLQTIIQVDNSICENLSIYVFLREGNKYMKNTRRTKQFYLTFQHLYFAYVQNLSIKINSTTFLTIYGVRSDYYWAVLPLCIYANSIPQTEFGYRQNVILNLVLPKTIMFNMLYFLEFTYLFVTQSENTFYDAQLSHVYNTQNAT